MSLLIYESVAFSRISTDFNMKHTQKYQFKKKNKICFSMENHKLTKKEIKYIPIRIK